MCSTSLRHTLSHRALGVEHSAAPLYDKFVDKGQFATDERASELAFRAQQRLTVYQLLPSFRGARGSILVAKSQVSGRSGRTAGDEEGLGNPARGETQDNFNDKAAPRGTVQNMDRSTTARHRDWVLTQLDTLERRPLRTWDWREQVRYWQCELVLDTLLLDC